MKKIVRALALSLVATGAFAATQIHTSSVATKVAPAKMSAMPQPMCEPFDPKCTL